MSLNTGGTISVLRMNKEAINEQMKPLKIPWNFRKLLKPLQKKLSILENKTK